MARRLAAALTVAMLAAPSLHAQSAAPSAATPKLTRAQRAALEAAVGAVGAASDAGDTPVARWQHHLLRASDGSHYVAFGFDVPAGPPPSGPLALYVRLERRPLPGAAAPVRARSTVAEWLAGMRGDPLPNRPNTMVGVQRGEMPVGGTQAMAARNDNIAAAESSAAISLMVRERDRARARQEEEDKRRRAELDGTAAARPELLPFEDFDLQAVPARSADGRWHFARSVVAGPGEYDLYVAWANPLDGKVPVAQVVKHRLDLAVASMADFSLSSVILADAVGVRDVPYPADQQAAHPYAIGAMEITPAADDVFTNAEPVSLVLQVINPAAGPTGKPDVAVAFRLFRVTPAGDRQVASLTTLTYTEGTLPADFDLRIGHPLFVAMSAPLKGLPRGDYRLKALASDGLTRAAATGEVTFRIVGTPATLLAEAPPLGRPFRRDALLAPDALRAVVDGLRPPSPSPGLARMLDVAAAGKFADLLREEPGDPEELGVRAALRGLAQYALGDSPTAAAVPLQRALRQRAAPAAPLQALLGACRAAAGTDREALSAWQAAIEAGLPAPVLAVPMAEAWLRLREPAQARAVLAAAGDLPADDRTTHARAAAALGAGDAPAALALLEPHLAAHPDDAEAQFLRLRALFTDAAQEGGAAAEAQTRFDALARAYADGGGEHAALVREWTAVLPAR